VSGGKMQDRRALDFGGDRATRDYIAQLERRLSGIIRPDPALVVPTFRVSAEVSNVITVAVQLKELDGSIPDGQRVVEAFTSTTQLGQAVAVSTSITVSTGTLLNEFLTDAWVEVLTDERGAFVLSLSHSSAATYYLNVKWKDRLFASAELVWT
jgi:hypothetical protein